LFEDSAGKLCFGGGAEFGGGYYCGRDGKRLAGSGQKGQKTSDKRIKMPCSAKVGDYNTAFGLE